ncbi:hypothetical protein MNV49_002943 [Pseudohyphozyma bogoriensis]|nr:hypothetical protein MNV49_002943 [Pseudohyphozyma bogoriensis]
MLSPASLLPALPFLSLLSTGLAATATTSLNTLYSSPHTDPNTGTILADGSSYITGKLNANVLYQASGKLSAGGCSRIGGIFPASCYVMNLAATGQVETRRLKRRNSLIFDNSTIADLPILTTWTPNTPGLTNEEKAAADDEDLDAYFAAFPEQEQYRWAATGGVDTRRAKVKRVEGDEGELVPSSTLSARASKTSQRNEIYQWPGAASGETWQYTWTTLLRGIPSTSSHYFHSWQILRRDASGGPVVTLDWKAGLAVITDSVVGCSACVTAPLNGFVNKPIYHSMNITYGVGGTISYKARSGVEDPLITYQATHDMGSSCSLKMGSYRLSTDTNKATTNFVMNYRAVRKA